MQTVVLVERTVQVGHELGHIISVADVIVDRRLDVKNQTSHYDANLEYGLTLPQHVESSRLTWRNVLAGNQVA